MINKIKRIKKQKELIKNLPSAFDEEEITWISPEFEKHERGKIWKILALFGVIVTAVLGFLFDAWTFSLAIIVFAVVYYMLHIKQEPQDQKVVLSKIGVKVGHRKYPFSRIKAFWIIYEPPFTKTLNLKVADDVLGTITIQLKNQSPINIREFLIEKIPEMEGQNEPVSDIFLRLFKI